MQPLMHAHAAPALALEDIWHARALQSVPSDCAPRQHWMGWDGDLLPVALAGVQYGHADVPAALLKQADATSWPAGNQMHWAARHL